VFAVRTASVDWCEFRRRQHSPVRGERRERLAASARVALVFALFFATLVAPRAQEPAGRSDQPVFRTSATLVTVDAVVTDEQGRHVTDLAPDDFEVEQSRRRQTLRQPVYVQLISGGAAGAPVPEANRPVPSAMAPVWDPSPPPSFERPRCRSQRSGA
jgi:hypothetical protein